MFFTFHDAITSYGAKRSVNTIVCVSFFSGSSDLLTPSPEESGDVIGGIVHPQATLVFLDLAGL